MEELREIIKQVKELVKEELNGDVEGNMILDVSSRIYNTNLIRSQKRPSEHTKSPETRKSYSDKPTFKQTSFLKRINKYRDNLTFDEAKQIISDHIASQKQEIKEEVF